MATAAAAAAAVLLLAALLAAGDSSSPYPSSAIFLYRPLCSRTCIKQTYSSCECVDAPCSREGPYRYKFVKKNDTDPARAYLFAEPGCRGDVTVVKGTTGGCRNFRFRSVKVCPAAAAHTPAPAEAER